MPISPNQGSVSGGTIITITGVNLANTINVYFGTAIATISSNTPTSITVISPAGNGVNQVTVKTPGGISNPLNFFYIPFPYIFSLSSMSGPSAGGNTVTINGIYLSTTTDVSFGGNSVVATIISDSQISVTVPAGINNVTVSVTTSGGTATGLTYTYYDIPTITSINPTSGSILGGTNVTITGTDLANTTNVTFGGITAGFGVVNNTTVTAITPANLAGLVDVVVTTTAGSATVADAYTYVSQPGI